MSTMNTASLLRYLCRLVLAGVVVVSLSACTDRADDDLPLDDTTAVPGGMQADPGAMQGHMAMNGDTVDVALVDYDINMPSTLPAGSVVFRVTNQGSGEHNFEVEGQGNEHVFPQNLQPGETQTMQVDLQQGSYEVYCPVGDHRSRGMESDLTVESSMGMN